MSWYLFSETLQTGVIRLGTLYSGGIAEDPAALKGGPLQLPSREALQALQASTGRTPTLSESLARTTRQRKIPWQGLFTAGRTSAQSQKATEVVVLGCWQQ